MTYSFSQTPVKIDSLNQLACFDSIGIKKMAYTKRKYELTLLEVSTLKGLNKEYQKTIQTLTLKDQNKSLVINHKNDIIKKRDLKIKKNKLFSRIKEGGFLIIILAVIL